MTFIERVGYLLERGEMDALLDDFRGRWEGQQGPALGEHYSWNDLFGELEPESRPRLAEPVLRVLEALQDKVPHAVQQGSERLHLLGALDLARYVPWPWGGEQQQRLVNLLFGWLTQAAQPKVYAQFKPYDFQADGFYGLVEKDILLAVLRLAAIGLPFGEVEQKNRLGTAGREVWQLARKQALEGEAGSESVIVAAKRLWEIALWSAASAPSWLGNNLWDLGQALDKADGEAGNLTRFVALLDWSLQAEKAKSILVAIAKPENATAEAKRAFISKLDYYYGESPDPLNILRNKWQETSRLGNAKTVDLSKIDGGGEKPVPVIKRTFAQKFDSFKSNARCNLGNFIDSSLSPHGMPQCAR
ncbi:MAG: hypothetical protein HQL56_10015 [Magnetococcales bacterium]|nr:hypothetical protein [Magnetococcales bacterium]